MQAKVLLGITLLFFLILRNISECALLTSDLDGSINDIFEMKTEHLNAEPFLRVKRAGRGGGMRMAGGGKGGGGGGKGGGMRMGGGKGGGMRMGGGKGGGMRMGGGKRGGMRRGGGKGGGGKKG